MESKMGCADCFLDFHSNHKRVPIENFVRKLSDKFTDVNTDMKRIMENKKLGEFQQELN